MSIQVTSAFKIFTPASEVYEAFVDPAKIRNFWWSSSSARWETGKLVTVRYEEYNAEIQFEIIAAEPNQRISFRAPGYETVVTITLQEVEPGCTIIEVTEAGWNAADPDLTAKLLDNKGGWTYVLSCLKAYLEFGVTKLRAGLVK